MGGKDEGSWVNIDGSVSQTTGPAIVLMSPFPLVQNGRGFGNDERRVEGATKSGRRQLLGDAGNWRVPLRALFRLIKLILFVQATLHFRTTTTASRVVLIGTEFCIFAPTIAINGYIGYTIRDYGCLTYAGLI